MSELALGTVQWGLPYGIANRTGQPSLEEVRGILQSARDGHCRILDTARAYGDSERIIGELTEGDSYWRVVTKLSPDVTDARSARACVQDSRRRLRLERIDTLLLHDQKHRTTKNGVIWDELRRMQVEGLIGELGTSSSGQEESWRALDDGESTVIQVAASLLDQRLIRQGFFDEARKRGKEVFIRSVFLQGVARMPPERLPRHLSALREPLTRISAWEQANHFESGTAYIMYAHSLPAKVVLGTKARWQLEANLAIWKSGALSDKQLSEVGSLVPDLDEDVLNPARWPATG